MLTYQILQTSIIHHPPQLPFIFALTFPLDFVSPFFECASASCYIIPAVGVYM